MEELLRKLHDYSRLLELEDSLPYWEAQTREKKARIGEMTENLRGKELVLASQQNPKFFQRIFGQTKKETLQKQIQEITAARTAAQWELSALEKRIAAGYRELEALQYSREAYAQAKAGCCLTPAQESRLLMAEISAFAPAAMVTAGRVLEALESAGFWMQQDRTNKLAAQEYISNAASASARLREILAVLPEGIATVGSYLRAPQSYFDENDNRQDRLHQAQEQVQNIVNQLKLLLGE